jgi:DNA-binding beta-propeller fold protein YncE
MRPFLLLCCVIWMAALASRGFAQPAPAASEGPYKLLKSEKVGGEGGFDYVYADSASRKLYIPRSNRVMVYDLDSLAAAGEISGTAGVHGAAVDPDSHHGFSSSKPVVMWDTQTLATVKTIDVQGNPDGILFDPATHRVFVFSHRAPNATVIDAKDGTVVGTIDLGGAPEQAASDGNGHVYVDIEDKDNIAVVDAKELKVTAHYDLGGKGAGPAGLALDAKNHVLFACCRNPAVCVILSSEDGHIINTLPIGSGCDGAVFNPDSMESFSSQRDGTLTVIKESSPTEFAVEQNVPTKAGAKTCTLDSKTQQIYLITAERAAASAPAAGGNGNAGAGGGGNRRGGGRGGAVVPGSFSILVVGK